jgi:hypothetical protein
MILFSLIIRLFACDLYLSIHMAKLSPKLHTCDFVAAIHLQVIALYFCGIVILTHHHFHYVPDMSSGLEMGKLSCFCFQVNIIHLQSYISNFLTTYWINMYVSLDI